MDYNIAIEALKHDQEHLIEHYFSLPEQMKPQFVEQLKAIDFKQSQCLFQQIYLQQHSSNNQANICPPQNTISHQQIVLQQAEFDAIGYNCIAQKQMAVCIMTGGQGYRLGFNHPKGIFDLQLKCGLTLFGYYAKKLISLDKIVKKKLAITDEEFLIQWYLMTSEENHEEIINHFEINKYFGLEKEKVTFFAQAGMPTLSEEGKIMLEEKGKISTAPGGNGVIYSQMKRHGILNQMRQKGISYIYVGPIDNILLKIGDPTSLGYLIANSFDIVSHYIQKRSAEEKVGIHLQSNGKIQICQYMDLTSEIKQQKSEEGKFTFGMGNRATMFITRVFVEKITTDQQTIDNITKDYHLVTKSFKEYDPFFQTSVRPHHKNGMKFQLFYFEVFAESKKVGLFQTLREKQFAPIKNAKGHDSPEVARKLLHKLHKSWLIESGVELVGEGDVEIDPDLSYNGEGLKEQILRRFGELKVKLPLYLSQK